MENKNDIIYCEKCRWWAAEEQVCCNADSEHCADFTCPYESCLYFELK
jgi:hypothetical protein